ncbi:hypothetical protein [Kumtagia ephedrae]|uniref:Uncharacterized protein n=1 Tax=Kumtagia ephedrae TaxID=2116701 RepID=A0A2P7S887_9HYPH|nr:hypothetical protein [Mesorhizobium ephedrae]PSJ58708.1 hypothetical protein C7I84_14585 [Mesorhizobium ephedrae]
MASVLTLLLRLLVMVVGYAAASLAASAFLHLTVLGAQGFTAEEAHWVALGSIYFSIPFVALFVAYYAFLPAAVAVVLAEYVGRRDWLTYALAGAAVGLAAAGMLWQSGATVVDRDATDLTANPMLAGPRLLALLIGAGICGGLGYWLIAGRSAGGWRAGT